MSGTRTPYNFITPLERLWGMRSPNWAKSFLKKNASNRPYILMINASHSPKRMVHVGKLVIDREVVLAGNWLGNHCEEYYKFPSLSCLIWGRKFIPYFLPFPRKKYSLLLELGKEIQSFLSFPSPNSSPSYDLGTKSSLLELWKFPSLPP